MDTIKTAYGHDKDSIRRHNIIPSTPQPRFHPKVETQNLALVSQEKINIHL